MSLRGALVACAALAAACSRPPVSPPSGPRDAAVDDIADGDAAVDGSPTFAGNGVPIPPLDPTVRCPQLVERVEPCTPACPQLTCDCSGTTQSFDIGCFANECLASLSCPAACGLGDQGLTVVVMCFGRIACESDGDCAAEGGTCFVAPGETLGACVPLRIGSECLADAECGSQACVAMSATARLCEDGNIGAPCNRDQQCLSMFHCALPAGSFVGTCTDGRPGSPCQTKADCQELLDCISTGTGQLCSAHDVGSPCESDDQCNGGFCVGTACDTGEAGARCQTATQCHVPFCVDSKCSDGAPGDTCSSDLDCQTHCSAQGFTGVCTNGQLGQACPCAAGLHCTMVGPAGTCAGPALTGAPCGTDADCQSGKCSAPEPLGQCTDGGLRQWCRDSSQCQPGLHCVSDGLQGVCVPGGAGDPCRQPSDCASGACLPSASPGFSPCPGVAAFALCGQGGVCIGGDCFPQTCAPTAQDAAAE